MTLKKLFIICSLSVLLSLAIVILTSCSNRPAPWNDQLIPCPTCCEKVNTIVYGREAGCKHEDD